MNPVATATATDLEIAGCTAAIIVAIFLIAIWAQRRVMPVMPLRGHEPAQTTPVVGHAMDWADVFDGRLARMEGWQKKADHDLNNLRAALPALPSKDAVHRLEVQVTQLAGKIETTDAVVLSTSRAVDRIEAHLLSGTREK